MGTYQHKLKTGKSEQKPRNWCFFDVEANIAKDDKDTQIHTCKLGWGCYTRTATNNKVGDEKWFQFFDADTFWNQLLSVCEKDRKLVVLGYNVGYDFRLVNGFKCLADRGYIQQRLYCKSSVVVMSFKKNKHVILVLDAMNYFNGKLALWGDMLGVPKGEVDFYTATPEQLLKYCKRDVLILKLLIEKWLNFITVNGFGHFGVTRASQSMIAYRTKYMKTGIYIHADKDATLIERASYYGGRTECFFIGKPSFKQFWKLDINSMYPYIMKTHKVPYNLRGVRLNPSLTAIRQLIDTKGLIAIVNLNTSIPAFPFKYNNRICFPVGNFTTTLAGPELKLALDYDVVTKVKAVAVYDAQIRFRSFVDDLYAMRIKYTKERNVVFSEMVKYIMNSFYGKWGQYNETWEECTDMHDLPEGDHLIVNLETGTQYRVISIAGQIWKVTERTESLHSFPGISSYITSAARVLLWSLILKAGRKNVFYTDTDSLIVNRMGYTRLKNEISSTLLGKLKLEYTTKKLILRCPKDYETDKENHIKGISPNANKINDDTFKQYQWQGLRGAINEGNTSQVVLTMTTKVLKRKYNKGTVLPNGYVIPYSLG